MAVQTKIQVRRDTAANWTSTNPTLAAGEVGFETDTLKLKVGNGSTAWTSLKYSQDASLLNGNASITTLTTTGDINTAGKLSVTASSGDEGGEIFLSNAVTNTSITNGVTIDVYQNKLRFFEQGGTARGYYIDITAGGGGASTNLVGGSTAFNGGTITNALVVSNTGGVNTSGQFITTIATGTAPFVVSSTTQVANLNSATSGISVNIGAGAAGSLPYQSAANTTTFLARTATNNSTLLFNSSTNAPYWTQPTLSNTYYAATTSAQLAGTISDETGSGSLVFSTNPSLDGMTLNAGTSLIVEDADSVVGRVIGSGNVLYIQAGADSTDGTGHIFVGRYANSNPVANITLNGTTTNVATNLVVGGTANIAGQITSTLANGTAPFVVTSTTQVANLNVAVSGLAVNVIGGTANKGELLYQSGVNTTAELTAPTTNMSALLYNTSTNAPYWATPIQALTSLRGYTLTSSSGGFTALTNTSSHHQEVSGTSGQTIGLPNTATLALGTTFYISGRTLGNITVNTFGNTATLMTIPGNSETGALFTCVNTATNASSAWDYGITKVEAYTGTGSLVLNTSPTISGPVIANATYSASAGLRDFDGNIFYSTINTTLGKGLDQTSFYYVSNATYGLDFTVNTTAKSLLGGETVGLTIGANTTFEYELSFALRHQFLTNTGITGSYNIISSGANSSVTHASTVQYASGTTNFTTAMTPSVVRTNTSVTFSAAISSGSRYNIVSARGIIRNTGTGAAKIYPGVSVSGINENGWSLESGLIFKMVPLGNSTIIEVGDFN